MRKYDQSFLLVRHGNIVSLIFYSYDLSDILTGRNFRMAERFRVEHRSIIKVGSRNFVVDATFLYLVASTLNGIQNAFKWNTVISDFW